MTAGEWVEVRKGEASVDFGQVVAANETHVVVDVSGLGEREYRGGVNAWHEASGRPVEIEVVTPADIRRRERKRNK